MPMKQIVLMSVVMALYFPVPLAGAATVEVGDSIQDVKLALGEPKGEIVTSEWRAYLYERGTVEFKEGQVVAVDLITKEELAKRRAEALARAERERRAAEERRLQRKREGRAELRRIRNDDAFAERSGAEQVAYWEEFRRKYPDVDIGDLYQQALEKYAEELQAEQERAEKEREMEIADAEPKVHRSSHKARRHRRRIEPGEPVITNPYTPEYRRLGGEIAEWPY